MAVLGAGFLLAQAPMPTQEASPPTGLPGESQTAQPSTGQIIIQSHGEPPTGSVPAPQSGLEQHNGAPAENAKVDVSDAQREALTVTDYDLDARLQPDRSGLNMRARVTLRNDGKAALAQVPLQISSTLHWESVTLLDGNRRTPLSLAQHRLDTDADHTGAATEAVVTLPEPLSSGASITLDTFYSGAISQNSDRLARMGANAAQQASADWDAIRPGWTGLRGFGNVLWYPVASPQLFLAEGNTLFLANGRMRQREQGATIRLRLSIEYRGEAPVAAYFCGRRAGLKAVADDPSEPAATSNGIATADFAIEPLGFRFPSLFVIAEPEAFLGEGAPVPASASAVSSSSSSAEAAPAAPLVLPAGEPRDEPVLALASSDAGVAAGLGAAADQAASLLISWLGPRPLSALSVLDHGGQPFQDGPLLVAPASALETSPERPALVYSLTHAWVQTGQPWMDEGLAQFFALLWVERDAGRPAALAQLGELLQPVALAEPNLTAEGEAFAGQPLISAADELFYRRKAAAVWWMLQEVAGEAPLRSALTAWRSQPLSHDGPQAQALAFEHLLERLSGKDLGWFFADWVLRDRGLPDLTITDVAVSRTSAGPGHNAGWLVAVTVKNEGGAAAEVPLILRSGHFSTTVRMRIAGFAEATQRVLVEAAPTEVVVNDGGTPELRVSTHVRQLTPPPAAAP